MTVHINFTLQHNTAQHSQDRSFIVKALKSFYYKYNHIIPLLIYGTIYMTWFTYLEKTVTKNYTVIHTALDDYIPFCEIFVVPYYLWFAYIALAVTYFFFKDREEYYKLCIFLATGMTLFLIVSTVMPNGLHLRLQTMPRDNIFTRMVAAMWRTDTPTNVWPSIHVYNSLGAHFAIAKSKHFKNKKWVRVSSAILATSIILSTMFIKQHSLFDVLTACILGAIMFHVVYKYDRQYSLLNSY